MDGGLPRGPVLLAVCRSPSIIRCRSDKWRYVGFALFLAGATVRLVAARTLGRQFTGLVTVQDNHRLVQAGIYGVIRHPMYLGLLIVDIRARTDSPKLVCPAAFLCVRSIPVSENATGGTFASPTFWGKVR
jgi:protein-S-isoprenylcysteine O-methyltransferase Ste14